MHVFAKPVVVVYKAKLPIAVFLDAMLFLNENAPNAELFPPLLLLRSEPMPNALQLGPVLFEFKLSNPNAELFDAVELFRNARQPIEVLFAPVLLIVSAS